MRHLIKANRPFGRSILTGNPLAQKAVKGGGLYLCYGGQKSWSPKAYIPESDPPPGRTLSMAIIEDIDGRDVAFFAEGLPEQVCGYFFGDIAQCDRD